MMSQKQCIEEVKRCLEGKDDVRLRNAARALADYARVTFAEITRYYPIYLTTRSLQIGPRYRILSAVVPELSGYKKMFDAIEKLRHKAEHTDDEVPTESDLTRLLKQVEKFQVDYDQKILPRLKQIVTPSQQLREEWKSIPPLISELQQYTRWSFANYSIFESDVKELEELIKKVDTIEDHRINDYRVKLRDLQNRMVAALEAAEQERQWEVSQIEYDQWRGK
jgi:hypothetical protein